MSNIEKNQPNVQLCSSQVDKGKSDIEYPDWYLVSMEQNWLIHDGTGSVWEGTDWYLVELGQYGVVLGGTGLVQLGTAWYQVVLGQYGAFMPVYNDKSVDLVRCYHSGTNERTNDEQGKIELLSHWTMEG